MTPQAIAREAAEAYTRQEYPNLCTGLSDDTADFFEIRDQLTALILSAAARMVRDSGAVEAIGGLDIFEAHSGKTEHREWAQHASTWLYRGDALFQGDAIKLSAALASLRAIGEGKP